MPALHGVRVLDLSRYLPGPLLTRILADLGADVIKVEPPGVGDALRHVPPQVGGVGAAFGSLNAGKRSVAIDLGKPEGAALVRALADEVDVLVESNRPGVLARLGLDPRALREARPRLVVCSLTGYGQRGSRARVAGHDLDYLAHAGVLGLFGPADAPPQVPGVQIADVAGAYSGALAVLAALLDRDRTGEGAWLDISLTRSSLAFATVALSAHAAGGEEARGRGMLTGGAPCYRCYETADGRHLAVGALEPVFWAELCACLGRPDLVAAQYDPGRAGEVAAVFHTRTLAQWVEAFAGRDVCCEPVRTPKEALADSELAVAVERIGGHAVVHPELGGPYATSAGPPPALGADTGEVLASFGVRSDLVAAAMAAGALPIGSTQGPTP